MKWQNDARYFTDYWYWPFNGIDLERSTQIYELQKP
jgi:hypothetical protein